MEKWVFDVEKVANEAVANLRECANYGFVYLQNPDGTVFRVSPDCKLLACGFNDKRALEYKKTKE